MAGFTTIEEAQKLPPNRIIDIIGLVEDALDPKMTTGSSIMSTFTLSDKTYSSLKVRCFRNERSKLPVPRQGDVVVLRNVKLSEWGGKPIAVSFQNASAPWIIYRGDPSSPSSIQASDEKHAVSLSSSDLGYIASLQGIHEKNGVKARPIATSPQPAVSGPPPAPAITRTASHSSPAPVPPPHPQSNHQSTTPNTKFTLLKNASPSTFVDLLCHVVKTYDDDWQDRFTLYVTDYTQNPFFYEYTEKDTRSNLYDTSRKWEGPLGKFTLQVTVWDANAYHCRRHVQEGSFVRLYNVNMKMMNGYLEGKVHGDKRYPEKVGIQIVNDIDDNIDERLSKLLARKSDYWRKIKNMEEERTTSKRKKKHDRKEEREAQRRRTTSEPVQPVDVIHLDDGENEKLKKAEPVEIITPKPKPQKLNGLEKSSRTSTPCPKETPLTRKSDKKQLPAPVTLNSSIKSDHPTVPPQPLYEILNQRHIRKTLEGLYYQLPFLNLRYRATIRIVDFFPSKIEDFAVPYDADCAQTTDNDEDTGGSEFDLDLQTPKWTWRFGLVVQDAKSPNNTDGKPARMELHVADQDAERLLRMSPVNLHTDEKSLDDLRSILDVLWGNLEQVKSRKGTKYDPDTCIDLLDSPSFTCCIKEYGVCTGEERIIDTADEVGQDERIFDGSQEQPLKISGWKRMFRIFGTSISA